MCTGSICMGGAWVCRLECSHDHMWGSCGAGHCSGFVVYLVSWNKRVHAYLLNVFGPAISAAHGTLQSLEGSLPVWQLGFGEVFPSQLFLPLNQPHMVRITCSAPFYLKSSRVWLIGIFWILLAFWHNIRRFQSISWSFLELLFYFHFSLMDFSQIPQWTVLVLT